MAHSLSFPLWIPSTGMSDKAGRRFSKSMAKPAPLSPFDLTVKRDLSSSTPHFFLAGPALPLAAEYVLEASVTNLCGLCAEDLVVRQVSRAYRRTDLSLVSRMQFRLHT